ncbi:MAG: lactonase family protein [Bryobacteraceae bacterium]
MLKHFKNIALSAFLTFTVIGTATRAHAQSTGAVFAMTNRAGNNEVVAFSRAADGTLTQTGRYSTRGNGIGTDFDTQGGLMLSVDNRFLYACNPGSDNVTVFAVNGSALTFLQKIYAGDEPTSITIHGNLLYVLDSSVASNQITGFTIASDGTLTPLAGSTTMLGTPIAVPGVVRFSPDGRVLVVTEKTTSLIDVFPVGANGIPGPAISNKSFGPRSFAAAFKNDGRLLVVESGLPTFNNAGISSYNVDSTGGTLSVITGSAKNGQTDGCWVVITNDQQYAFTANFVSSTLSSFRLGTDGTVALINGTAASPGAMSQPTDLGFSADSRYLYNLLRGTGGVAAFRVETNGSLTPLGIFGVGAGLPVNDGASGLASY